MKQSTHAKETRTVRSRRDEDRQEDVKRLRDLPAGDEAKAQRKAKKVTTGTPRKIVLMGKHHTVEHPALQWERDDLLDQLWKTERQVELWRDPAKYAYNNHPQRYKTNAKNSHRNAMMALFQEHIDKLKKRLLSLDEQISPIQHGR